MDLFMDLWMDELNLEESRQSVFLWYSHIFFGPSLKAKSRACRLVGP